MKETLKVKDILSHCEESAKKCRILADKAIENVGHGESEESAIGACAFFMQEQRMYRQIIPDIIKNWQKARIKNEQSYISRQIN